MTTTTDLFSAAANTPKTVAVKARKGKAPSKRNGNGVYDESKVKTLSSLEHIRLRAVTSMMVFTCCSRR